MLCLILPGIVIGFYKMHELLYYLIKVILLKIQELFSRIRLVQLLLNLAAVGILNKNEYNID